jgi:hypothetical protein
MFLVQPECEESYVGVLKKISSNPDLVCHKQAAMRDIRCAMASVRTTRPLVEAIVAGTLLPRRAIRAATMRRRGTAAVSKAIGMIQRGLETHPAGRKIAMRLRASLLLRNVLSRLGVVAAVK